tara:strand:- start:522 stop:743 length:222 start_codon:yes stop_codon:yes gene_type:complete
MSNTDYIYKRPDGGTTHCYGKIEDDSNFELVCADEDYDGIADDVDAEELNTWKKVCDYLYENYRKDVEEIVSC